MAIIMNRETEKRTELTDRVSTNLRERTKQMGAGEAETDFMDNSEYGKELRKQGRFGWVWFILILLAAISLIVIFLF